MDYSQEALRLHKIWNGKLDIVSKVSVTNKEELSVAYTPGVAAPCLEIQKDTALSYVYTGRANTIAVITDGSAVLGLGDIGPEAGMPVMEGKCVLFKEFGGINAVPLCIRSKDADEIVNTIKLLSGSFGGINLEDISAPRCFEIERRLKQECDIPVFHDDQHGTAVVVLAALVNAAKLVGKTIEKLRIIINGAGAAGVAIARLLLSVGAADIIMCDRQGALHAGMICPDSIKQDMAEITNPRRASGMLGEVIENADVFIGVSAAGALTYDSASKMAKNSIIFALANPVPEIMPDEAKKAGAAVVGTGRSDFSNQINNVLAFPGIFRGALDARAKDITEDMKIAAAYAIASLISDEELSPDNILPTIFDKRLRTAVATAVAAAAGSPSVRQL